MDVIKSWIYSIIRRFRLWGGAVVIGITFFLIYTASRSIPAKVIITSEQNSTEASQITAKQIQNGGSKTDCQKLKGDKRTSCWIGEGILRKNGTYYNMLKAKADNNNVIILASVDTSYLDLAYNMYETSFKKYNVTNFLYVCSDAKAVEQLKDYGLDCFLYKQETDNAHASEYGTKGFMLKMRVKRKMVMAALMLGFTVVMTDLDVVFTRNPLPELLASTSQADAAFMSDIFVDNGGFYLVRPNLAGKALHKETLDICMTEIIHEQVALARVITRMTSKKTLKKVRLEKKRFACGLVYFEEGRRMFAEDNPCNTSKCETSVIHNNWIVSKEAKIFRFKETGHWMYDFNGYYNNPKAKYLMYQNPLDFGKGSKEKEKAALATAFTIGRILNRTVIMPRFHCYGCGYGPCKISKDHCSFIAQFHVRSLDAQFPNAYRENPFLQSPLVPKSVKDSISKEIIINTAEYKDKMKPSHNQNAAFDASDFAGGKVSENDIVSWFNSGEYGNVSVLKFHSLYFDVTGQEKAWRDKITSGIKYSNYKQFN